MKGLLVEEWSEWQGLIRDRKHPRGRTVGSCDKPWTKEEKIVQPEFLGGGALHVICPTGAGHGVGNYCHNHSERAMERRNKNWVCLSCCSVISCRSFHWTRSQRAKESVWCSPQRSFSQGRSGEADNGARWGPADNNQFINTKATL